MKFGKCVHSEALARTFPGDLSAELLAHRESCAACQKEWESLERLRLLGQALPTDEPETARADAVRARLLYQVERLRPSEVKRPAVRPPRLGPPLMFASACLVCVAIFGAGLRWYKRGNGNLLAHETTERRATIEASGKARFVENRSSQDDVIRLFEGTLAISVPPLHKNERFRVAIGDAEVEVRGTAFSVTATADRLQRVFVEHGLVEVRPAQRTTVLLGVGQHWDAETPSEEPAAIGGTATSASAPASAPAPAPASAPAPLPTKLEPTSKPALKPTAKLAPVIPALRPLAAPPVRLVESPPPMPPVAAVTSQPPATAVKSPAEQAFSAGFLALKEGRFLAAAPEFERAAKLAPSGPLAEDAQFWSGVCYARAGRSHEAIANLQSFLKQYPNSPRVGEASVAIGWLFLRSHRLQEAGLAFQTASQDKVPSVKESARAGLAAIGGERAK